MISFSSLRMRLVGTVLLAVVPALTFMYLMGLKEWTGFLVGVAALAAAWYARAWFVRRQMRAINAATRRLAAGDLESGTGVKEAGSELGQLARTFDTLAASLQQKAREREEAERTLLGHALQQTVVAALGQFALVSNDLNALFNQAVMLAAQTVEAEHSEILELLPGGDQMLLRAGAGWKRGCVGSATVAADRKNQAGYTLATGEPVVVQNFQTETRCQPSPLLKDHGIMSGATVLISTRQGPWGVLGVHATKPRTFSGEEVHFLMAVGTALALVIERKNAEAQLQQLATFVQMNPNPAMELTGNGEITYFNDAARKLAGSDNAEQLRAVMPPDVAEIARACLATGQSRQLETRVEDRTYAWVFHPITPGGVIHCYVEDITSQLNLESQLRQAQKMESVGQLAAGVAHDFNNMLTIIQGHAGILLARPTLAPEHSDSVQAIYFASERAAGLTRQLLMFSRKNVMQPRLLDLREVVANMSKMLIRILGETVTLEFKPPPSLPLVEADAGMIEQVIMNLSVNARDAMPRGGTLTIAVNPVSITEADLSGHPEARPGTFICLEVSDTGFGMDGYTITRIFEPFFTTKEVGKGTGLGLATVYGIVKQHEGWIEVASEVDRGTRFTAYFPASGETAKPVQEEAGPATSLRGGKETILIVEDEPVLRDMAQMILSEFGYRVLEAANGREALNVWTRYQASIDLLLTDMVMPEGISGVELAEKLLVEKPGLKVIFASGYTVDDVSTEFLKKNNHACFMQKPYTRIVLAQTVRQALDGPATPTGGGMPSPAAANQSP